MQWGAGGDGYESDDARKYGEVNHRWGAWCISSVQEDFHLVYSDAEYLYPLPASFHKRSIERNEVRPESVVLEKLLRY